MPDLTLSAAMDSFLTEEDPANVFLPKAGGTMDDGAIITFDNASRLKEGTTNAGANGGIAQVCSIDYELKWEAGRQYVMQQDGTTIRTEQFAFNTAPTATSDETEGYVVGSRRILDDGTTYLCTDATEDEAVWSEPYGIKMEGSAVLVGDLTGNARGDYALDVQGSRDAFMYPLTYTASGYGSVCVGNGNKAEANRSSAIGSGNSVNFSGGSGSGYYFGVSAFGYSNTASGDYHNSAFGSRNTASGYQRCSAFGYYNNADAVNSCAFGKDNTISNFGNSASAFGVGNTVSASYASAFGNGNTIDGSSVNSSAVGYSNTVSSFYSSAFGYKNTVSSSKGSAFGYDNNVSQFDSSACGYKNTASGTLSTAFGSNNNSLGDGSVAIGNDNSTASGSYLEASAIGIGNTANGTNSSAIGSLNVSDGSVSTAFGVSNTASGDNSVAFGKSNTTSGYKDLAIGIDNTADSDGYTDATAIGYNNDSLSGSSVAIGNANTASAISTSAVGNTNTASANSSSAFGKDNTASGVFSSAFGGLNTASGDGSSAFGHRTKTTIAQTFEAGYWSSATTRSSAVRMHPNGQVAMTIVDSATAPLDGGATAGSEADARLPRGMYAIQKNGTTVKLYFNNAGTIQSLTLGVLS
jgi:hypothetical protein